MQRVHACIAIHNVLLTYLYDDLQRTATGEFCVATLLINVSHRTAALAIVRRIVTVIHYIELSLKEWLSLGRLWNVECGMPVASGAKETATLLSYNIISH